MIKFIPLVVLLFASIAGLLIGFGVISWQKRGAQVFEQSDKFIKKAFLVGGFAALVLFIIKTLELAGAW